MSKILVAPSILSADFGRLNEEIASIESAADLLHVDVMDGHFVNNLTFGIPIIKNIKTSLPLDCHLMVESPEIYLEDLAEIGVKQVSVHVEACKHLNGVVNKIKELGMKAGVVLNPATPVEMVREVINIVDFVMVMTVNPGYGGQKMIESSLLKIGQLKKMRPDLIVEVEDRKSVV